MTHSCLIFLSIILKFKQFYFIWKHNLHVKMCLEIIFYFIWKLFVINLDRYKSLFLKHPNNDFVLIQKISKKNIKKLKKLISKYILI